MSNLLYHHCLDVNSYNIKRSLEGIILKLSVHGHQHASDKLSKLTESLDSASIFKDEASLNCYNYFCW